MAMTKDFIYSGYSFLITVKLRTKIEKCIDGKIWHTIIVNSVPRNVPPNADNYFETREVEDSHLESSVLQMTAQAKEWVNEKYKTRDPEDARLTNLGFKND